MKKEKILKNASQQLLISLNYTKGVFFFLFGDLIFLFLNFWIVIKKSLVSLTNLSNISTKFSISIEFCETNLFPAVNFP